MGYLAEKKKGEVDALNICPIRENNQKKTAPELTPNEYFK